MSESVSLYEFKEIREVTDVQTWNTNPIIFTNAPNPINEVTGQVVMREALKLLHKNKISTDWEVVDVKTNYTKNHPKCYRVGEYYLELIIWLKRAMPQKEELV